MEYYRKLQRIRTGHIFKQKNYRLRHHRQGSQTEEEDIVYIAFYYQERSLLGNNIVSLALAKLILIGLLMIK